MTDKIPTHVKQRFIRKENATKMEPIDVGRGIADIRTCINHLLISNVFGLDL